MRKSKNANIFIVNRVIIGKPYPSTDIRFCLNRLDHKNINAMFLKNWMLVLQVNKYYNTCQMTKDTTERHHSTDQLCEHF